MRRVINRIVNRPSEVRKRWYLKLLDAVEPFRAPESQRIVREKPVLIISGITMHGTGVFCNMLAFLRWVYFAEIMGYTPVIDMQYVPNLYLEDGQLGKVNSYEYFYRQPAGMSAEEAYKSRDVFIVNRLDCPYNFSLRQKLAYKKATAVNDWVYGENREKHYQDRCRDYVLGSADLPLIPRVAQFLGGRHLCLLAGRLRHSVSPLPEVFLQGRESRPPSCT